MVKVKLAKRIASVIVGSALLMGMTACGARGVSLDKDMIEHIYDKYGIEVTIVDSYDLNGKTPYDRDYYGTNYTVEYDGLEFLVYYTDRDGYTDNYLEHEVEDDFIDILTDEFGRNVVRQMDISVSVQMTDDTVASMDDLEDSDFSVSISVFW